MIDPPKQFYLLYYSHGPAGHERLWYAVRRPGDGGADWEYTLDRSKARAFSTHWLTCWVKAKGKKACWYPVPPPENTDE